MATPRSSTERFRRLSLQLHGDGPNDASEFGLISPNMAASLSLPRRMSHQTASLPPDSRRQSHQTADLLTTDWRPFEEGNDESGETPVEATESVQHAIPPVLLPSVDHSRDEEGDGLVDVVVPPLGPMANASFGGTVTTIDETNSRRSSTAVNGDEVGIDGIAGPALDGLDDWSGCFETSIGPQGAAKRRRSTKLVANRRVSETSSLGRSGSMKLTEVELQAWEEWRMTMTTAEHPWMYAVGKRRAMARDLHKQMDTWQQKRAEEHEQLRRLTEKPIGENVFDVKWTDDGQLSEADLHQRACERFKARRAMIIREAAEEAASRLKGNAWITAVDVIRMLPNKEIQWLREKFDEWEQGGEGELDQENFIEIMTDCVDRIGLQLSHEQRDFLQHDLVDLFVNIDFDGSGNIDWEEFTSYIMHTGSATSTGQVGAFTDDSVILKTTGTVERKVDAKATKLYSIPFLSNRFLVVDTFSTTSRMTLYTRNPLEEYVSELVQDRVMSAAVLPALGEIRLVLSRHKMVAYKLLVDKKNDDKRLSCRGSVYMPKTPIVLEHCTEMDLLFGGTIDGEVCVYDTAMNVFQLTPQHTYPLHNEPVSCLLPIPSSQRLLSACLFGEILVIDLRRHEVLMRVGKPSDRPSGVHHMLYSPDTNVLTTAGYDCEPTLWMLVRDSANPRIGSLVDGVNPHKQHILGMWQGTKHHQHHLITADAEGVVKVWDLRRLRCLQTHTLEKFTEDNPHPIFIDNMVVGDKAAEFYLCGRSRVTAEGKLFEVKLLNKQQEERRALQSLGALQSCTVYSPLLKLFVSASASDLHLFDGKTGSQLGFFPGVQSSTVTTMAFDTKGRKLYIGTYDGHVVALNVATGGVVQEFKSHAREVVAIVFYGAKKQVISGAQDGTIYISSSEGSSETPVMQLQLPDGERVSCMSISTVSELLVVGDSDENIHLFDIHSERGYPVGRLGPDLKDKNGQFRNERDAFMNHGTKDKKKKEANFKTDQLVHGYNEPLAGEITSLIAIDPYSVVVSADSGANLSMWTFRPHDKPHTMFCKWKTFTPQEFQVDRAISSVVTTMAFRTDTKVLYTGDDQGCLSTWSLTDPLDDYHCMDCSCKENVYNSPRGKKKNNFDGPVHKPAIVHCFQVGEDRSTIVSVQYVETHCAIVASTASGRVHIFDEEGRILGLLYATGTGAVGGTVMSWSFHTLEEQLLMNKDQVMDKDKLDDDLRVAGDARIKPKRLTRAQVYWGKIRDQVLGHSHKFYTAAKTLLSLLRSERSRELAPTQAETLLMEAQAAENLLPLTPCHSPVAADESTDPKLKIGIHNAVSGNMILRDSVKPLQLTKINSEDDGTPREVREMREQFALELCDELDNVIDHRVRQLEDEELAALTKDQLKNMKHFKSSVRRSNVSCEAPTWPQVYPPKIETALLAPTACYLPVAVDANCPEWIAKQVAAFSPTTWETPGVKLPVDEFFSDRLHREELLRPSGKIERLLEKKKEDYGSYNVEDIVIKPAAVVSPREFTKLHFEKRSRHALHAERVKGDLCVSQLPASLRPPSPRRSREACTRTPRSGRSGRSSPGGSRRYSSIADSGSTSVTATPRGPAPELDLAPHLRLKLPVTDHAMEVRGEGERRVSSAGQEARIPRPKTGGSTRQRQSLVPDSATPTKTPDDKKAKKATTDLTSTSPPGSQGDFEALLHSSAPFYPLQESPYLALHRAPPAISPFVFAPEAKLLAEGAVQREHEAHKHAKPNEGRASLAAKTRALEEEEQQQSATGQSIGPGSFPNEAASSLRPLKTYPKMSKLNNNYYSAMIDGSPVPMMEPDQHYGVPAAGTSAKHMYDDVRPTSAVGGIPRDVSNLSVCSGAKPSKARNPKVMSNGPTRPLSGLRGFDKWRSTVAERERDDMKLDDTSSSASTTKHSADLPQQDFRNAPLRSLSTCVNREHMREQVEEAGLIMMRPGTAAKKQKGKWVAVEDTSGQPEAPSPAKSVGKADLDGEGDQLATSHSLVPCASFRMSLSPKSRSDYGLSPQVYDGAGASSAGIARRTIDGDPVPRLNLNYELQSAEHIVNASWKAKEAVVDSWSNTRPLKEGLQTAGISLSKGLKARPMSMAQVKKEASKEFVARLKAVGKSNSIAVIPARGIPGRRYKGSNARVLMAPEQRRSHTASDVVVRQELVGGMHPEATHVTPQPLLLSNGSKRGSECEDPANTDESHADVASKGHRVALNRPRSSASNRSTPISSWKQTPDRSGGIRKGRATPSSNVSSRNHSFAATVK